MGGTALCLRARVEAVRTLIGADVDQVNKLGWTALLEAIMLGDGRKRHQRIVDLLVRARASVNVNLAHGKGVTPLQHARARLRHDQGASHRRRRTLKVRRIDGRGANMTDENRFLCEAIELARGNIDQGGRPFGAVVVRGGQVIATGVNEIAATNDPTAHAEMSAIRAASRKLESPDLSGCAVYASGHPCPMCMAAMRLSGVERVVYAYSNDDGAPFGLSTAAIYEDLAKPFAEQSMKISYVPARPEGRADLYEQWRSVTS
jgi:tRNA(Arg) A34 adenosine deaminase TadA